MNGDAGLWLACGKGKTAHELALMEEAYGGKFRAFPQAPS
jgi:hypothetical protein